MESREAKINKALGVDFQWVVADRVIAAWEDEGQAHDVHYLGRLSSHNRKAEFSLMLGHLPEEENVSLLLFHLPLRVRAGSASKPIDLFVVIPVESFHSASPLSVGAATASEIPEPHLDAIKSAGLDNCPNVLRVQFNLKEPGYVMMPRMKVKSALVGTPRELLLNLRSLSRALSFNVYLKRNTYSQVALANFSSAVLQGDARTPALRLKSMYLGRGAKRDAWDLFGLNASDTPTKAVNPLAAKALESDREDGAPPPPYEQAVQTPTPSPEKPEQEAVTSNHGEEQEEENDEEPRAPNVLVRGSVSPIEEENVAEPRTPNALVRDGVSFVSETPPPAPAAHPAPQQIPQKRAFADAESPTASDTEAEETRKRASKTFLPLFASSSSLIPGSPPLLEQRRPHSISSQAPNTPPPPRQHPTPAHSSIEPTPPPPSPPQHDSLPTETLLREIATWLQDGWVVDAHAHQKLLLPLLALGYQARRRDVAAFDLVKGRCTALLYVRIAAAAAACNNDRDAAATAATACEDVDLDVEEDLARLVAWANGAVFRGAESVLREETMVLGKVAARVCEGGGAAGATRGEYWRQRALWVASVFVCFGAVRDVDALDEGRFALA